MDQHLDANLNSKKDSQSSTDEISDLPLNSSRKFFTLLFFSSLVFTSGILVSLFFSFFFHNELSIFSYKDGSNLLEIHWTISLAIMIILVIIVVIFQTKFLLLPDNEYNLCIIQNFSYNTFISNILFSSYFKILSLFKSFDRKLILSILLTISIVNLAFIYPYYEIIKRKRYTTFLTYLTFFVYISIYLLFSMYLFVYSLINFIYLVGELELSSEFILTCSMIIAFSLFAVVVLAYYKDVYFNLFFLLIFDGYLINNKKEEGITLYLTLFCFLCLGIGYTSIKHKNDAFGIPETEEYTEIIETYKRSNLNL